MNHDVIVIGAGHNGLVAASGMARAGLKTLVLERSSRIGGAAITSEIHPGFRISTLSHASHLAPAVAAAMDLARHGLELIDPEPRLFVPAGDGRNLILSRDAGASGASIAQFSARDAERYPEFLSVVGRITQFASAVQETTPPDIEQTSRGDLWTLLKLGRRFRGLGSRDAYRLLRWAPMSVADFASEWFESEPLRAAVAGPGIFGTACGPRSAGSTAVLLMHLGAGGGPKFVKGGLGALTAAMAATARAAGVEIRTGSDVARVDITSGRAVGVTLASGEQLRAKAVVSNADPRRTLLGMVDPIELSPSFLERIRSYRSSGRVAKINLALSDLPRFPGADPRALAGRIQIGPTTDYLEHAFDASKYGGFSPHPYLDITIPSLADPALAPAGAHVMSIAASFAPFRLRGADWITAGPAFADAVVDALARFAPGIGSLIVRRQVITPADLESEFGLTGGHIFHGELALDQLFTMRPLLGWARYRTPIHALYLCGAGTHPGYGVSGLSGLHASREVVRDLGK
jgi:phytoene dehydrogenase-like protein